ncbi:hypothetical protein [Nostoc sp. 106C]|uniref:hypothetical protein n=1 Tax=Nostoc sp. 106C TaxID=1932667 RepID=UPI001412AC8D|nr:hypothetical protein [Nostoc sp. 106C]
MNRRDAEAQRGNTDFIGDNAIAFRSAIAYCNVKDVRNYISLIRNVNLSNFS